MFREWVSVSKLKLGHIVCPSSCIYVVCSFTKLHLYLSEKFYQPASLLSSLFLVSRKQTVRIVRAYRSVPLSKRYDTEYICMYMYIHILQET